MTVRVGLIGCGYWGPNLLRNFAKTAGCQVSAIADLDTQKLGAMQQLYPLAQVFHDGEELLAKKDVDAVAIATPTSSHYRLVKTALLSGKHVFVEKPITASIKEAEELVHIAEREHRVLMVDHTFVYTGAVQKIRELLGSGEVGEVCYYDAVRVNLGMFRHDENVLWDLGPHDLSILAHLVGKRPGAVSAVGAGLVGLQDWKQESIAYVNVWFSGGVLAHIHLNWLSPVKIRRTLIGCTRKMIIYDHLDPDYQVKVFDKGVNIETTEQRYQLEVQYRSGDMVSPKVDQSEALGVATKHFVSCIRQGGRPITDGYAGLEVVRLLEAAQQSMKSQGELVSIRAEN